MRLRLMMQIAEGCRSVDAYGVGQGGWERYVKSRMLHRKSTGLVSSLSGKGDVSGAPRVGQ
ncbi:hypothetical protein MPC4_160107 [Methylocella tundrae]|uniref:Uncharacterized protein n=1 Tax=Methylocella tundrae TaxID=227605 RepID=A0A8B6M353_METTU|nr:hypothetical protein MPC1_90003 [Methylocella tundrae]VTZ49457.1 hypothetical protein MPC4_160107 [Methylocella tundrae]